MQSILELMKLDVHGVELAVNEEKQIEGILKTQSTRIDERREAKRPSKILHVGGNDGLEV